MKRSIETRIEKLLAEARKITRKPDTIFLTGQLGNYTLAVHEWDGVWGSARNGDHIKRYSFEDKATAINFADRAFPECEHKFDVSILTGEEWDAICPQTLLEARAEKEGRPLCKVVLDAYGYIPDFWAGILENKKEIYHYGHEN